MSHWSWSQAAEYLCFATLILVCLWGAIANRYEKRKRLPPPSHHCARHGIECAGKVRP